MIDRTKPLTEQPAGEVRALLDALHGNRERYDRANRIVEVRSCDLEISEATRALAIINRRATEAEDQRATEERESVRGFVRRVVTARVACVAGWSGFEPGSIERMVADIADRVAEGLGAPMADPAQREADLREAFIAGIEHGEGWLTDEAREGACGPDEVAAAEYARGKAGG